MTFTVNSIPQTITGSDPRPTWYGKTARENHTALTQQASDEFQRTGDNAPQEKLDKTTIRYTPAGTIAKDGITNDAINNAIGYAKKDIEIATNGTDTGISPEQLADRYKQPTIQGMKRLKDQYKQLELNPSADQATKAAAFAQINQKYVELTKDAEAEQVKAANFFAATDVKDANGQSDGKITADELAAKLLFDDSSSSMFNDNQVAYKTVLDGLQAKSAALGENAYTGPSFQKLQQDVSAIQNRQRPVDQPLEKDGQITSDEKDISEELVKAPIPTNQIVSSIHQTLNLKQRVDAQNAFIPSKL